MTDRDPTVVLEIEDHVAHLRLNRPAKLNSMSPELVTAFDGCLDEVEQSDARVVVVTGAGRAFSAGGDLATFSRFVNEGAFDALVDSVRRTSAVLTRLERLPQTVVGSVNGLAVAGGLELLLCCDVIVAAEGALIGDGHVRYAVLPGGGGSVRLPRRVAPAFARRLLLTGDLLPAEAFVGPGLVARVVPQAELASATLELARRLAGQSARVSRTVKALLAEDEEVDAALKLELDAFAQHVRSEEFRAGVTAFTERRPGGD